MKHKRITMRIGCVLAIFAIALMTTWDFSVQLQNTLTKEVYRTLSEVAVDYNKAFSDRIAYNIKTMKVLAGSLAGMKGQARREIVRILQNAVDDGAFVKMAVCDASGHSYGNDGTVVDIAHRDYFHQAMRGKANVSAPLVNAVTGKRCIVIAVPIRDKSRSPMGALLGVYPLDTTGSQLLDFNYHREGYGFVVTPDGTIVLSSEHADKLSDEENLFSFFEKTEQLGFSTQTLRTAIKNGESAHFAFRYHGEKRFVSCMPSSVNDWYTFSIASDALMCEQERDTNRIVFRLVLGLIAAGILLVMWLVLGNRRHNKETMRANQRYQSLLSHMNGGMIIAVHALTAEETIAVYVSSGFTDMTGYTLLDIQTLYAGKYLDVILAEDRKNVFDIYLQQLKQGNTYRMPYRIRKKDGSIVWVMDNGYLVEDVDGLRNYSIIADITVIKQQEEALRLSENRFSVAVNASSGTLFEIDLERKRYTHFENAERIFGIAAEKLLADTEVFSALPYDEFVDAVTDYFFHPDDVARAKDAMGALIRNKTASYEARLRRFDGGYIWARVDLSLSLNREGQPSRLVGFMTDIDDIKKQAEVLENKVQADPMTGLYNKIAMATLANKILSEYPNGRHALIVLDIDDFKGINDTLGHAFGDLVLIELSTKLKVSFRNNDIVGRMGGDEFAVLMKNVPDTSSVLKKATELSGAFRQTYAGEKGEYTISCSIGIIMIEKAGETFDKLYRKADAALYRAKQDGKDQFVLYQEKDAALYSIDCTRTNDEELQNLKASHTIEAQIFELLYTAKDFSLSINMALAAIGQQYHVSRVAIFENDAENRTTSNIYEWCNAGVTSAMANLQNMHITLGGESILDCFDADGLLYCNDVRELPRYMREILLEKDTLSNLQVAIFNDDRICGFIGFDECTAYRVWTSEEIEKLSFLSKVLSVFLFKRKTEVAVIENLHTRLKILDVLPDYICVVNPETHALVYANGKMQQLLPEARPGAFCFTTLRGGQAAPCETCLIERVKRGDTSNLEIVSADGRLRLTVKALSINWSDDKKMVLLYGTEKPRIQRGNA
ncbi:MAG: diguanylate cyclase [Clostridia bacterium]